MLQSAKAATARWPQQYEQLHSSAAVTLRPPALTHYTGSSCNRHSRDAPAHLARVHKLFNLFPAPVKRVEVNKPICLHTRSAQHGAQSTQGSKHSEQQTQLWQLRASRCGECLVLLRAQYVHAQLLRHAVVRATGKPVSRLLSSRACNSASTLGSVGVMLAGRSRMCNACCCLCCACAVFDSRVQS